MYTNEPNEEKELIKTDYTNRFGDKNAFSRFIHDKCKEYNDLNSDQVSIKTLAGEVGIKYEVFRKIVNEEKPTRKRDCILALCFVLKFSEDDFIDALDLYPNMRPFNLNDDRDEFIASRVGVDKSIQELNTSLIKGGLMPMNIHRTRETKEEQNVRSLFPYMALRVNVYTSVSDQYYYGDPYDSLCTTYNPSNCEVTGKMIIENKETEEKSLLTVRSDGRLSSEKINEKDSYIFYSSLEETGSYKNCFVRLYNAIDTRHRRLCAVLNDTKNYQCRTSARLIGDHVCVFSEEFSYSLPELEEYYMLCLSDGEYRLDVYGKSAFMYMYLSESAYNEFYGMQRPEVKVSFNSCEQIKEKLSGTAGHSEKAMRYRIYMKAFNNLKLKVDDLYRKLMNKDVFIQNADYIFDKPVEYLEYYHLQKDFQCKYDPENDEIIADCLDSKEYKMLDDRTIEITLQDVKRAFELGFDNIDQICRIKAEYGSIEAVL